MEKDNVVTSDRVNWKISKPLNRKNMRYVTSILILGFVTSTYLFTDGYKIHESIIIVRNVSIPFTFILVIFIYKWIRFRRNIDICIERQNDGRYNFNSKTYSIDNRRDYIRVVKYGNRYGTALFGIYLMLGNRKMFVVRDLYDEEYTDIIKSLSSFLGLKVVVFD